MKLRSAMTATVLTAAALGMAAPMASAAGHQSGAQIAAKVLHAKSPQAAFKALSTADKIAYGQAEKPVQAFGGVEIKSVSPTQAKSQKAHALGEFTAANMRPDSGGCWNAYAHYGWKAAAGNTVYTAWQTLGWCSNGSNVTSYWIINRGGETSTPGWSYQGDNGQGAWNVGWEVRQYTQEKFTFGIGSYGYSTSPCVQVRGGATGLYSSQASCSLN